MNLHRALSDIAEIRAQLDRTETYRGFRSAAVGVSVLVLIVGVFIEKIWVRQPLVDIERYLAVWMGVAVGSGLVAVVEMVIRGRRSESEVVWKTHRSLALQIAPSLFVGLLLTMLIASHALEQRALGIESPLLTTEVASQNLGMMWALPGVWSLVYGLGLFSCQRNLPPQVVGVAVFFVAAGALMLAFGWVTRDLDGWQMMVTFGVGQAWMAWVLFWDLENRRDKTES